jgi:hypothetical protein
MIQNTYKKQPRFLFELGTIRPIPTQEDLSREMQKINWLIHKQQRGLK